MNHITYNDIENKIKEVFIQLLHLDKEIGDIDSRENLFLEEYGYSSIDALELLVLIEDEFDVSIPEEKLNSDLLESVKSLADYIYELMKDEQ